MAKLIPSGDENDTLIMSVKLSSGKFEPIIQVPLHSSEREKREFVEAWLELMQAGIRRRPVQTRRPPGGTPPCCRIARD